VSLKSFSLVPFVFLLMLLAMFVALSMNFMISTKFASLQPLVVIGALPILIPEGTNALLSPGTVFLLIEMEISFMRASTRPPSEPLLLMSATNK